MILFIVWLCIGSSHFLHSAIKNFAITDLIVFGQTMVVLNAYILFRIGVSIYWTLDEYGGEFLRPDDQSLDM